VVIEFGFPLPWPPQAGEQELRMACVGNLFPTEKGQDIMFEVLGTPKWRERNWHLTLYGNGPNREILEHLVATFKLQDRVSFAGYVAVDKVWRENHILLMPSRYEGMPLTIVEAMFCGRPVVATDVGGNSELIEDGRTGFLAEAAVAKCFANALERMWSERYRLKEIGMLAAAGVRELVPEDPVGEFAKKLRTLANNPK
jgi:glycosyltransferase involved in cell wall biosynthesis